MQGLVRGFRKVGHGACFVVALSSTEHEDSRGNCPLPVPALELSLQQKPPSANIAPWSLSRHSPPANFVGGAGSVVRGHSIIPAPPGRHRCSGACPQLGPIHTRTGCMYVVKRAAWAGFSVSRATAPHTLPPPSSRQQCSFVGF